MTIDVFAKATSAIKEICQIVISVGVQDIGEKYALEGKR